jgi:hypothetical protein
MTAMMILKLVPTVLFFSVLSFQAFSEDAPPKESPSNTAVSPTQRIADGSITPAHTPVESASAPQEAAPTPPDPATAPAEAVSAPMVTAPVESTPKAEAAVAEEPSQKEKISSVDLSLRSKTAETVLSQSVPLDGPDLRDDYKRNRIMQTTGFSLLGTAVVLILAGASIIESAPWGTWSQVGISFVGVGLAHFITSAFLLGFSRAVVIQELPPVRQVQIIHKSAYYRASNGDIYF